MAKEQKQDEAPTDVATATIAGFQALVSELKADREQRTKHEEKIVTRLGKYKENPDGSPKRSAFNTRGQRDYPLPALKCRFFAPHPIDPDPEISGMTREEIELANLLQPGEYRITLNDNSQTAMTIEATVNKATGAVEQMRAVSPAFDREMFKQMPPLVRWLREALAQHPEPIAAEAGTVLTMAQEKALIASGELAVAI